MRYLFLIFLTFSIEQSVCQPIKILVGKTSADVESYYDSLFSQKNNKYYATKKQVSDQGDLILEAEFAILDLSFYKCTGILSKFQRIDGVEICTKQIVYGKKEYAYSHLEYIKDKFQFKETNKWTKPFLNPDSGFDIIAEFMPMEKDSFYIVYYIV